MNIPIKRVYDPPSESDGQRILVDRLWPRGLTKDKAKVSLWLKEIAPSADLRTWFGHDPARWAEFQTRYRAELDANTAVTHSLRDALKAGPATLVYGARDTEHNQAVALAAWLDDHKG
jgi:uncharacterized protein YeaO (DUF488 family)